MAAQVIDMNSAKGKAKPQKAICLSPGYLEDLDAKYLFRHTNARGQTRWFYRINVNGLYPRVFGPFSRKSDAIANYNVFLQGTLDAICECANRIDGGAMEFVQLPVCLDKKER